MCSVEQMNESGCEVQRFFFFSLFPSSSFSPSFFPVFFFKWCIAHTTYTTYMLSMCKNSWWRCLFASKQKWVGNKHKIAVPTGSCPFYIPRPPLFFRLPPESLTASSAEETAGCRSQTLPSVYACGVRVVRQSLISHYWQHPASWINRFFFLQIFLQPSVFG